MKSKLAGMAVKLRAYGERVMRNGAITREELSYLKPVLVGREKRAAITAEAVYDMAMPQSQALMPQACQRYAEILAHESEEEAENIDK